MPKGIGYGGGTKKAGKKKPMKKNMPPGAGKGTPMERFAKSRGAKGGKK